MIDMVGEMTDRLLADAGLGAGMRVLDVGCGAGDVSFRIAQLVGGQGQVVGIDRDARPLAAARDRARELGLPNVTFAEGDLGALAPEHGLFDAVVGRRVLMYQPDPAAAVKGLSRALRPGGLVVFQEHDATMVPASLKPLPLHERAHQWMWRTVEREGADIHIGFHLAAVLEQAGLDVVRVRAEAIVQTPRAHHRTAAIIRAMLPRIVQQGVATEAEIDVDTLEERLAEERTKANATYVSDMVFGAWARKPA
ncbi:MULTISPECIES: class I SAM-dependent methyltransferase [Sorangium]|uniref:Methyltransferase n=1 Tax=Sorangium cellulosum TaxID=56 RepID=A0A4P2QWA0_SORCE|nr:MULTISPECIES: class I SAM-dependent methyltransferase [Sorangium]AUX34739.1 methyltransferase [Sorangium cellulosum]WCQ94050.1 2-phytyl-1,4-beta-naphthoquinone methyltransferase, chloroplastic [Sorangium sp. Soce836]